MGPTARNDDVTHAWRRYLSAADRERRAAEERAEPAYPHFSEDGHWRLRLASETSSWHGERYEHGNWTAGFSHGVWWLRAIGADDEAARAFAHRRLPDLAPRAEDITTHDLGFLFSPSFVLGHDLGHVTNGSGADQAGVAHRAARTLAARMNDQGGFLQAFGTIGDPRSAGTSTIDTMLNLPLLWWSAAHGGDPGLHVLARRHARTSARLYFRSDDSTSHLLRFDPHTGALVERATFQGAGDSSCWSRGQAWAACGFAWAYAATGETELLEASERAAAYFLDRLPASGVPPWDFSDTDPEAPRDASAATVTALGALILAETHPDPARRTAYAAQGRDVLVAACGTSLNDAPDVDGILVDSCYSKPDGLGIAGATGWGDYFTGLALALATGTVDLPTALGFVPES